MGGLIARQYIKDYPSTNHLNKLIAIGTPFQGSWLLEEDSKLGDYQPVVDATFHILNSKLGLFVDTIQPAAHQMRPGSEFLESLNSIATSHEIQYFALYGNINLIFKQQLFGTYLYSDSYNYGDLIVRSNSARTVSPYQPSQQQAFTAGHNYTIERSLEVQSTALAITLIGIDYQNWPYYHSNLPKNQEIKSSTLRILEN
jgi:hypothetical protein